MSIWPFNRNNANNDKVPLEVKKYYESEHRERVGLAWLVAFLSLLATIAIVAGLFFGGRWLYRKVANKDKDKTPTTGQTTPNQPDQTSSGANRPEPSTPNDLQPAAPSQNPTNNSTRKPKSSDGRVSQSPPHRVVDTGPGSTLAIFLAVTVLATMSHSIYLRQKR